MSSTRSMFPPGDDMETLLGAGGVFDELHRWKAEGRHPLRRGHIA